MSRVGRSLVALALAGGLAVGAGCHRVTYTTGHPAAMATHQTKAQFFLWGLVGQTQVDLKQICPEGAAWWRNQISFVDGLLGTITLGIYTPVTVLVRCQAGQTYLLQPDAELGITWVEEIPRSVAETTTFTYTPSSF